MSILIKPIISEKATRNAEEKNRYSFVVAKSANKIEIKQAIEAAYNVSVSKVQTINVPPVRKSKYTKTGVLSGKTNSYKKAYVQVADGDTIDFYSNI
jgi:large subunit ribosomal protein L23